MNAPVASRIGILLSAGLWVGLLLGLMPLAARAQATSSIILSNGPTANRINLVVLSEGYQASELAKFRVDATNAVNALLGAAPYQEYKSYFNAFAISVASAQSGSDHYTPTVSLVNTYFNSTYDSYGIQRLVTIPPNDRDSNYSDGRGKVDALLASLMPEYDLVLMLVNDPQYGGSGGSVLLSSLNSSSPEIVVHESGHTFGHLTDEYSDPYPGWIPVEYPNATAQTSRSSIKWTGWINGSTPVPTPATAQYSSLDGLFLGAEYQTNGWYRPKEDCKMNHLGVAFCEICGEQLVKSTCGLVRFIDAFAPATNNLSITTTQAVALSVTTLQPRTHNLNVQWFTNGLAVTGGTNRTFTLFPQSFSNDTYTVQAQVRDPTTLVRSDPANVLSNSVAWTVTIALSQLHLASPQWLGNRGFSFNVNGTALHGFVLQASTNLYDWVPVSTNFLSSGQFSFTNSAAAPSACCFYRAAALP